MSPMTNVASLALALCVVGAGSAQTIRPSLEFGFEDLPDRRWPGPAWMPSRVQDWRVADGRLVCDDARLPFRTAALLVARLEPADMPSGAATIATTITLPDGADRECAAGVLVGAGHAGIDYRITALVQQSPAPDGGIMVLVGRDGEPRILDFSNPSSAGFSWVLPTNATLASLPLPSHTASEFEPPTRPAGQRLALTVEVRPDGDAFSLTARTSDLLGSLGTSTLRGLPRRMVDGGISLVAHRSGASGPGGIAFDGLRLAADKGWIEEHPERAFGPIVGILYSLDRDEAGGTTLRLTAQTTCDGRSELPAGLLEVSTAPLGQPEQWQGVASATLDADSRTLRFEAQLDPAALDLSVPHALRVSGIVHKRDRHNEPFAYTGVLRREPPADRETVAALLSCVKHVTAHAAWNEEGVWFPHAELVRSVLSHDPDLCLFAGDQIYEGDLTGADGQRTLEDYHTKWQRFLWSFGDLTRTRPCVTIPDDHDVYHGNLWGAGGVRATAKGGLSAQDAGGYKLPIEVVNAIHRTQVSNLPPTRVSPAIGDGVTTYSTRLRYGGMDLAIVADRMWKDSASVLVPEGKVVNGYFRNPDLDPRDADAPAGRLLGSEQERWLAEWAGQHDPRAHRKFVLSQTPWICATTLPRGKDDSVVPSLKVLPEGEWPPDDEITADTDSGGWPQSARQRAVEILAHADAVHLAGDQHLASVIQYAVRVHRDGPFAFTSPAMANTWPRRFMPSTAGANPPPGTSKAIGDHADGFGNRFTMWAVANPRPTARTPAALHDLAPGYGIVRTRPDGTVLLECRPRYAGADGPNYAGWPFTVAPSAGKAGAPAP